MEIRQIKGTANPFLEFQAGVMEVRETRLPVYAHAHSHRIVRFTLGKPDAVFLLQGFGRSPGAAVAMARRNS